MEVIEEEAVDEVRKELYFYGSVFPCGESNWYGCAKGTVECGNSVGKNQSSSS